MHGPSIELSRNRNVTPNLYIMSADQINILVHCGGLLPLGLATHPASIICASPPFFISHLIASSVASSPQQFS